MFNIIEEGKKTKTRKARANIPGEQKLTRTTGENQWDYKKSCNQVFDWKEHSNENLVKAKESSSILQ